MGGIILEELEYREIEVKQAFQDVIYLLERGYHKNSSLNFVTSRYLLTSLEKNIIFRTAVPIQLREKFLKKHVSSLKDEEVGIDGFNLLITVEKILQGSNLLFKGLDGFLRDVTGVYGKYSTSELTTQTMNFIIASLEKLEIRKAVFLLDRVVSHSGELVSKFRKMNPKNFIWEVQTSHYTDIELLDYDLVLSHDSEVAKKANKIFDLPLWMVSQQPSLATYTDTYQWLSEDFLRLL